MFWKRSLCHFIWKIGLKIRTYNCCSLFSLRLSVKTANLWICCSIIASSIMRWWHTQRNFLYMIHVPSSKTHYCKMENINKNSPLLHIRDFHITIVIVLWSWEEFLNILYYLTVKPYGCFTLLSFKLTCYLPTVGSSVANPTTLLWPYAYSALYLNLRWKS